MRTATFYHAGCPVCVDAERQLVGLLDRTEVDVEVVHLGENGDRVSEARLAGVASVPALVLDRGSETASVLHINHGADLADLVA